MTTATTTPGLETLRQEIAALENEISNLNSKLAVEQRDLASLETEYGQIAEAIALGQEKPSKAGEIARRTEQVEARVSGFRSVLARKQAELDRLWPECRRLEADARLSARKAEVETLKQKGAEAAARINEKLAAIIATDFPELDSIRDRLTGEFRDLGGQAVAAQIIRTLVNENGALLEEFKLTDNRDWARNPAAWRVRGDIGLTLRNLEKIH